MKTIRPFESDSQSLSLGGLTIENGTDRIAIYGSLDLTKDNAGLERARELKAVLDAVVHALQAAGELPDRVEPNRPTERVKNPFE